MCIFYSVNQAGKHLNKYANSLGTESDNYLTNIKQGNGTESGVASVNSSRVEVRKVPSEELMYESKT